MKGDDTCSGAAGKVGLGALVIRVVGRLAPLARLIVWAFAAIMPRVLAVTLEAIRVRWQLALA
jgi:hypothetical protein